MRTSRSSFNGRRALVRLAEAQHGVFERSQARAVGCSDALLHRLVAAGEVERVWPRVYRFTAAPRTRRQSAKAASLYAGEGAWLSHRSAAFMLDMIDRPPGVVEIISVRDFRSRPGLEVRRVGAVPRAHTRIIDSIPITNANRTMVDLASVLGETRLEEVLDDCTYRGLVERERMLEIVRMLGGPGRRRTRTFKKLLAVRGDDPAMPLSVLEHKFLKVIRKAKLAEPEKQVALESDTGKAWRLDFVYAQHKVHIEVDGRRFHAGRRERNRDRRRDNFMNIQGWIVLRFTWEDVVREPEYVVEQVRRALGTHAFW
ncbi:MAG: DUF559 domain-containing protein [Actinomycetota bacterium]